MTVLYINNEYCHSLERLRDYFSRTLNPQDEIYQDLLDSGRDHSISAWLQEHGETELSMQLENIDSALCDSEFFSEISAIILGREDILIPCKTDFSRCLTIESFEYETDAHGIQIKLKLRVMLAVNENYEFKIQTSWGTKAISVNPFEKSKGYSITEIFHFGKRFGQSFGCLGVFVDNKKQNIELVHIVSDDDFMDLGLSVKWAKCNLGTTSPEGYGDYYFWGETSPKDEYTEENSKTYKKSMSCIVGNSQYDAATASLGQGVRLPTKEEFQELVDNCTIEWTTRNRVNGLLATSNINGYSIFLPAAGYRYGTSLNGAGKHGIYWSSTSDEDDDNGAYYLYFDIGGFDWGCLWNRNFGYSVRPVHEIKA